MLHASEMSLNLCCGVYTQPILLLQGAVHVPADVGVGAGHERYNHLVHDGFRPLARPLLRGMWCLCMRLAMRLTTKVGLLINNFI